MMIVVKAYKIKTVTMTVSSIKQFDVQRIYMINSVVSRINLNGTFAHQLIHPFLLFCRETLVDGFLMSKF